MLCGRFVLAPPHARLLRRYLPSRLVARTGLAKASLGDQEVAPSCRG